MGATLATKVYVTWGKRCSDNSFRVLMVMALTSLDQGTREIPAGTYFGGHDSLTTAIKDSDTKTRAALLKAVQRAIDELRAINAIELVQAAKSKGNAVYRLTLNSAPGIYKRDLTRLEEYRAQVDTTRPAEVDASCPAEVDTTRPTQVDTTRPALSKEPQRNHLKELEEECGVDDRGPVAVHARDADDDDTPNSLDSKCADPTCTLGFHFDASRPVRERNYPCPVLRPHAIHESNVTPLRRLQ